MLSDLEVPELDETEYIQLRKVFTQWHSCSNGQHLLRWLFLNDVRIPHNDAIVGLLIDANNSKAMETWPHSITMAWIWYSRVQHGHSRVSLMMKKVRYLKKLRVPPATKKPSMLIFHSGAQLSPLQKKYWLIQAWLNSNEVIYCNYCDFSDSASKNWLVV